MSVSTDRLSDNIAKLEAQLSLFSVTLNKMDDIVNGTAKTGGLKERMAIVEEEAKRNKESFLKIERNIVDLRTEMLIEIGKIATAVQANKSPGINWNSILQAVITAIAVGVTGVIFWRIILVLAASAPPVVP